jgi:hypothetical protein
MKIPERVFDALEEAIGCSHAAFSSRSLKARPFARQNSERCKAPLRMI